MKLFALTQELHDKFKKDSNRPAASVLQKMWNGVTPEHHRHCEKMVSGACGNISRILEKDKKGERNNEIARLAEIIVSGSLCSTAD